MKITSEEQLATILLNKDVVRYGNLAEIIKNLDVVSRMGEDAAGKIRNERLQYGAWNQYTGRRGPITMAGSGRVTLYRELVVEYVRVEKRFLRKPISYKDWTEDSSVEILVADWDKVPKVQIKDVALAKRFLQEVEEALTRREENIKKTRERLEQEEVARRSALAMLGLEPYQEVGIPGEKQQGDRIK